MNGPEICLFPRPQKLTTFSDRFPIPSTFPFYIEDDSFQIVEPHLLNHGFSSVGQASEALILILKEKLSHPEAYNLKITPSQIIISETQKIFLYIKYLVTFKMSNRIFHFTHLLPK